jgi:hypothetical protein
MPFRLVFPEVGVNNSNRVFEVNAGHRIIEEMIGVLEILGWRLGELFQCFLKRLG